MFVELLVDAAIQANILWRFNAASAAGAVDPNDFNARRLPIYLYIFISAHLLQVVLTLIAIRTRNTVQVVALAIFNALLLVYAGIEVVELRQTLDYIPPDAAGESKILTLPLNILSGIVLGVLGLAQVIIVVLTWYIWKEFGWRIYRFLGADLAIRRFYRQYQVYESVLCFSFFFFLSFSIQFLFLVLSRQDPEYALTWAMLPISALWLGLGMLAARREWRWPMRVFLVGLLVGMAYFIFKLVRVWQIASKYTQLGYDKLDAGGDADEAQPAQAAVAAALAHALPRALPRALAPRFTGSLMDTVKSYYSVRKSLTVFSALSIFMLILCIVTGVVVLRNFGKGLKEHIDQSKPRHAHARFLAMVPAPFSPVQSNPPSSAQRLTID